MASIRAKSGRHVSLDNREDRRIIGCCCCVLAWVGAKYFCSLMGLGQWIWLVRTSRLPIGTASQLNRPPEWQPLELPNTQSVFGTVRSLASRFVHADAFVANWTQILARALRSSLALVIGGHTAQVAFENWNSWAFCNNNNNIRWTTTGKQRYFETFLGSFLKPSLHGTLDLSVFHYSAYTSRHQGANKWKIIISLYLKSLLTAPQRHFNHTLKTIVAHINLPLSGHCC